MSFKEAFKEGFSNKNYENFMRSQAALVSTKVRNLTPLPVASLLKNAGLFLLAFSLLTMIPALYFEYELLTVFYGCGIASLLLLGAWLGALCGKRLTAQKRNSASGKVPPL